MHTCKVQQYRARKNHDTIPLTVERCRLGKVQVSYPSAAHRAARTASAHPTMHAAAAPRARATLGKRIPRPGFPLADLPAELQLRILRCLIGAPRAIAGRAAGDARHAFALACCSRALLRLFRAHCLAALCFPSLAAPGAPFVRERQVPRFSRPRHVASVVWLAGPALRVLRLPVGAPGYWATPALAAVADYCPCVEELAFPADGLEDYDVLRAALTTVGSRLRTLEIYGAGDDVLNVLEAESLCRPSHLKLTNVKLATGPDEIDPLSRILANRSSDLVSLDLDFERDYAYKARAGQAVISQLTRRLCESRPLKVLRVNVDTREPFSDAVEPIEGGELTSSLEFDAIVGTSMAPFEASGATPAIPWHLEELRFIGGEARTDMGAVLMLLRYCNANTRIILDINFSPVMFSMWWTSKLHAPLREIRASLEALCLLKADSCSHLEIVTCYAPMNQVIRPESSAFTDVLKGTGRSLCAFHLLAHAEHADDSRYIMAWLTPLLDNLPGLHTLSLPASVVFNALKTDGAAMDMLLGSLSTLRSLSVTSRWRDGPWRCEDDGNMLRIVLRNFPNLTNALSRQCALIEYLSLEVDCPTVWTTPGRKLVRRALNELAHLEKTASRFDAEPCRQWLRDCLDRAF